MIAFGRSCLRVVVKVMSQASPVPFWKAGVSSQSISTPSRILSVTNFAKLVAHAAGSIPKDVGF